MQENEEGLFVLGVSTDERGELCEVYGCPECETFATKIKERAKRHAIQHHHEEEFMAGVL